MSGVKLNIHTETAALERNVAALAAMTGKTAHQSVREASVMVVQAGANIVEQSKKAKRDVLRAVRRYRYGVEELAMGARPEAPGDKLLFLIPRPRNRRPIAKSGDRRYWVFETAQAAREHQPITFRGIAKAGFWAQLPALGKPVPAKYARQSFLADVPGLKSTSVSLDAFVPSVTVENRSTAIGFERSNHWKTHIMSRVTNRIAGMARANEKRLAAFRQAGGVSYDETTGEYAGMEE